MRSGTLHIASLLFPIFHKVYSIRKCVDQIWLFLEGFFFTGSEKLSFKKKNVIF